jgi:hypothetical protein
MVILGNISSLKHRQHDLLVPLKGHLVTHRVTQAHKCQESIKNFFVILHVDVV